MTTTSVDVKPIKVIDLKLNGYHRAKTEFKDHAVVLELLNYIDFLSMTNSFSADGMEIPVRQLDGKIELGTILFDGGKLDRPVINALYFTYSEKAKEEEKKNVFAPSDVIRSAIKTSLESRKASAITTLKQSIDAHIRQHTDHASAALMELIAAREKTLDIEAMTGADNTKYVDGVIEAIGQTNFNFHKYDERSGSIEFVSRTDVILKYQDKGLGIDYAINCGKYRVVIEIRRMVIKVVKHQGNVFDGVFHPHCMEGSQPCWGNAESTARDAILKGDIGKLLKVIDSILVNYNPGSPYISIYDFNINCRKRDERLAKEYEQKINKKGAQAASGTTAGDEWDDEDTLDDEPLDLDFADFGGEDE